MRFSPLLILAVMVGIGVSLLQGGAGLTVQAAGAVRNVSAAGADTGNCTATACLTISYAIGQSSAGDTILVGPGTYRESLSVTKSLQLEATNATIDATGKTNGILIQGPAAAGSTVSGFTVMNALQEGILAKQTSSVTIINNTVKNNDLGAKAAILVDECAPQGEVPGDCGEAIHLWSVSQSTVSGNTVSNNMGGILLTDESGPTFNNNIVNNTVSGTGEDCGIVLASHQFNPTGPVGPSQGGIYGNLVSGNTITNSGSNGAGVGLFAAAPGGATYNNRVIGNTMTGNGLPGVAIHSHAPNQNVNGNVITNNTISNNGADDDAGSDGPTGISVFADVAHGASPVTQVSINSNTISNEKYGIFMKGVAGSIDTSNNTFAATVTTQVFTAPAAVAAPAASPTGILPPSTGDAGLKPGGSGASWWLVALAAATSLTFAGVTVRSGKR